jgi:hypothetical protein
MVTACSEHQICTITDKNNNGQLTISSEKKFSVFDKCVYRKQHKLRNGIAREAILPVFVPDRPGPKNKYRSEV